MFKKLLPLPSGELTFCYGKSPCLMGKSTISMAIFHSFLYVHQRVIFPQRHGQVMARREVGHNGPGGTGTSRNQSWAQ